MISKEEADRQKNPEAERVKVGCKWTWSGVIGKKREEQYLALNEKPKFWIKTGSSFELKEETSGWKIEKYLDEDTFESMFLQP